MEVFLRASLVAVLLLGQLEAQQPPRDTRPTGTRDTAQVSGLVLSADASPKPLRRAVVTLTGGELTVGRTAITTDEGAFVFDRLPPGRYLVTGSKDGFVPLAFGATRPNRVGTRVIVSAGERRTITLNLPRGAVITGTLTTQDGQPMPGISVSAMGYRYLGPAGERRLIPAGVAAGPTDDRGVYRIFGLPAGEYAIMAQLRQGPMAFIPGGELEEISPAEIRRALSDVRDLTRRTQPGPPSKPPLLPAASSSPRRTLTFAPAFYPGTGMVARARLVPVAAGEERSGIDFSVDYVPTARVQGTVAMQDPSQALTLMLTGQSEGGQFEGMRTTRAAPDGSFMFNGVAPGNYMVIARSGRMSAETQVAVHGEDVAGVTIMMQPGITISGRVVFEGSTPPPATPMALRFPLPAGIMRGTMATTMPPVDIAPNGTFAIAGVMPGPYRFNNPIPAVRSPAGAWWLKSVTVRGREILDAPAEFRDSADDAVITFVDRVNELSGMVRVAAGESAPEGYAVVFSADRVRWFHNSRAVAAVRPAEDGRYSVKNLPPGEYLVAATADVEDREWFDPSFLERLSRLATRVTIGAQESKTLDLAWVKTVPIGR